MALFYPTPEKMQKAQILAEFIAFLAIGFFLAVLFASIIGSQIKDINDRKEISLIRDFGISIKSEIDLAAQVNSGYERNFTVPNELDGVPFNISIVQSSLIVATGNKELVFKIPNANGNIKKGPNTVRNQNGAIYLN